jgi:Iap family predicted aminopeptidase
MSYAQVVVEGWQLLFEDASGRQYPVHTAQDVSRFVICFQAAVEKEDELVGGEGVQVSKEAAINAVMEHLEITQERISVVSIEAVEWRDSCLGCEIEGQMCLSVITPGYRVTLEVEGRTYAVHLDRTGQRAILCDKPSASDSDN